MIKYSEGDYITVFYLIGCLAQPVNKDVLAREVDICDDLSGLGPPPRKAELNTIINDFLRSGLIEVGEEGIATVETPPTDLRTMLGELTARGLIDHHRP